MAVANEGALRAFAEGPEGSNGKKRFLGGRVPTHAPSCSELDLIAVQ